MEQRNVIVFGAHPDDIEIGMGGTIKKLTDHKQPVIACIATVPDMPRRRKQEVDRAANILGITTIKHLDIQPKRFGFNRETVSAIDRVIQQYNPDAVFT
ncbi:MAG: PIG-L family deacetylase, partial [Patescibacteria group bacterium]